MTNMLFYVLLLGMSATFMNGAIRFSGINRSFYLLQRGVMEYATVTCDENDMPYFNETVLKESIDTYFETNITRYTKHYTTAVCYLNDDNSVCINGYCHRVRISLKADINFLFEFDKAIVFTISSLEGMLDD